MKRQACWSLIWICVVIGQPAEAGVFNGTVVCPGTSACAPARPSSNPAVIINPYGIVHPPTFQDAGGALQPIRICVNDVPGSDLAQATEWAVAKWNALLPVLSNCSGCKPWLVAESAGTFNFYSTVLHELGHCAMGLNHTDLVIDANGDGTREQTNYTISYGGATIGLDDGADNVRGSKDDDQDAAGGSIAEIVYWFTKADNNPITESLFSIDGLTYSRAFSDLATSSSTYAASANVGVAELLGEHNIQSVMGRGSRNMYFFELSADDVQTIEMARTGLDRTAGTSDDYTVSLQVVPCTDPHEVTVEMGAINPGFAGICTSLIDFTTPNPPSPALANSYKTLSGAVVTMNTVQTSFQFNHLKPLLYGSFESGTYDAGWVVSP